TLSTVPGGGIRTEQVIVNIQGIPTLVQQQVVTIAGPDGVMTDFEDIADRLNVIVGKLGQVLNVLCIIAQIPIPDVAETTAVPDFVTSAINTQ
ncbi:MAG: hypothetical protein WCL22_04730, partial [bacterium]